MTLSQRTSSLVGSALPKTTSSFLGASDSSEPPFAPVSLPPAGVVPAGLGVDAGAGSAAFLPQPVTNRPAATAPAASSAALPFALRYMDRVPPDRDFPGAAHRMGHQAAWTPFLIASGPARS